MIEYKTQKNEHIFCYLLLILDAYNKGIVERAVGETLETDLCFHALRMVLMRVDDTSRKELIHYSDRGCRYASKEYTSLPKEYGINKYGINISMTENGNPKDSTGWKDQ